MSVNSVTRSIESPDIKVIKARRSVRAIVNSEDIDGHGTVIDPSGINLSVYRKNPTVLVDHGKDVRFGSIPVASATDIRLIEFPPGSRRRAIEATVKFREDAESDRVWQAYADGTMRGFSVNVLPKEAGPPTREQVRMRPELEYCSLIYHRTELRELSATSVPSNPAALVQEIMRHRPSAGIRPAVMTRAQLEGYSVLYSQTRRAHERAVVGWYRTIGGGLVDYASFKNLSVEDLEKEIKRLRLMCELCELMGKMADKEKWAAEAALIEVEKQALAAGTGRK